jgi:cell division protein FtsL
MEYLFLQAEQGSFGVVMFLIILAIALIPLYFIVKVYKCYFKMCSDIEDMKDDINKMSLIIQQKYNDDKKMEVKE